MTATLQLTINGNEVSGSPEQLVSLLQQVSTALPATATTPKKKARKKSTKSELPFEEFIVQQITPELGSELAQEVVDTLIEIKNNQPDFRRFRAMYHKVATIEHRQLLKVVSAVWRLKYATFLDDSYLSAIFSTIKYATICPHCGALAASFVIRLKQEGLIGE
jgi:hypothetical protein